MQFISKFNFDFQWWIFEFLFDTNVATPVKTFTCVDFMVQIHKEDVHKTDGKHSISSNKYRLISFVDKSCY